LTRRGTKSRSGIVVWVEFENDSVFLKGGKSEWVRKGVREAGHKLGEA